MCPSLSLAKARDAGEANNTNSNNSEAPALGRPLAPQVQPHQQQRRPLAPRLPNHPHPHPQALGHALPGEPQGSPSHNRPPLAERPLLLPQEEVPHPPGGSARALPPGRASQQKHHPSSAREPIWRLRNCRQPQLPLLQLQQAFKPLCRPQE